MERTGKQVSLNKIANILKIAPDTAKRYLGLFEQSYLIHLVPRYGKTNETLLSSKKVYARSSSVPDLTATVEKAKEYTPKRHWLSVVFRFLATNGWR